MGAARRVGEVVDYLWIDATEIMPAAGIISGIAIPPARQRRLRFQSVLS